MQRRVRIFVSILLIIMMAVMGMSLSVLASTNESEVYGTREYAEGEAIVCYVEEKDLSDEACKLCELPSASDSSDLLAGAEILMRLNNEPLEDVQVEKKMLSPNSIKEKQVDEVIAVVKSDELTTEELITELEKLPNVSYAEPNYREEPLADYTSYQWAYNGSSQYGMQVDNWNDSSNVNAEDTVVAVLDTGIDYNHEDLRNVMWSDGENIQALKNLGGGKYGIYTASEQSDADTDRNDPMDTNSHGTHCAGIIGAQWNNRGVSGAANGVKIMAVRAGKSSFYHDDLIEGMDYVKTAKENGVNVVAVNNSWGGNPSSKSQGVYDAINRLGNEGVICVFAAGNNGSDCDQYYSDYVDGDKHYSGYFQAYYYHPLENTIIVGSSDSSGNRSNSSNYGKTTVDVFASGVNIYSTGLNNTYSYKSGTSMACPSVVGEVAILKAADPYYTASEIIEIIKSNTTTGKTDIKSKCVSGGYANVSKALEDINANAKCTKSHSLSKISAKTATTSRDGNTAYWTCNRCGKYFSDAEGKNEIQENSWVIAKIDSNSIALSPTTYQYDGTAKEPAVTVKDANGKDLVNNADYTVSYKNNTNAGTATATVTFKGNYSGSKKLNFEIKETNTDRLFKDEQGNPITLKRIAGSGRYETAIESANAYKKAKGIDKFDNIIVACGDNFPDALGGGYLAKVKNAPILLVNKTSGYENYVYDYVISNLRAGGTVYLLGGSGVITSRFENKLQAKCNVKRLSGLNRYDTNLKILEECGTDFDELLVCTGTNYPDSLSASAAGRPIFLIDGNTLTQAQQNYLDSIRGNVKTYYAVGGTGVVSEKVMTAIKSRLNATGDRLAGASRYETSVAVANKFFPKTEVVTIAVADNFPDGLSGGPTAMMIDSPIVLITRGNYSAAQRYAKSAGATKVAVLGGPSLISDDIANIVIGE